MKTLSSNLNKTPSPFADLLGIKDFNWLNSAGFQDSTVDELKKLFNLKSWVDFDGSTYSANWGWTPNLRTSKYKKYEWNLPRFWKYEYVVTLDYEWDARYWVNIYIVNPTDIQKKIMNKWGYTNWIECGSGNTFESLDFNVKNFWIQKVFKLLEGKINKAFLRFQTNEWINDKLEAIEITPEIEACIDNKYIEQFKNIFEPSKYRWMIDYSGGNIKTFSVWDFFVFMDKKERQQRIGVLPIWIGTDINSLKPFNNIKAWDLKEWEYIFSLAKRLDSVWNWNGEPYILPIFSDSKNLLIKEKKKWVKLSTYYLREPY